RCRAGPAAQRAATRLAIDDLRFAAWFLWMTPLEAALSSLRIATRAALVAASLSPAAAASRNLRTELFRPVLTALLRSWAFSFCLLRLICDLMFAMRKPRSLLESVPGASRHRLREERRRWCRTGQPG